MILVNGVSEQSDEEATSEYLSRLTKDQARALRAELVRQTTTATSGTTSKSPYISPQYRNYRYSLWTQAIDDVINDLD